MNGNLLAIFARHGSGPAVDTFTLMRRMGDKAVDVLDDIRAVLTAEDMTADARLGEIARYVKQAERFFERAVIE